MIPEEIEGRRARGPGRWTEGLEKGRGGRVSRLLAGSIEATKGLALSQKGANNIVENIPKFEQTGATLRQAQGPPPPTQVKFTAFHDLSRIVNVYKRLLTFLNVSFTTTKNLTPNFTSGEGWTWSPSDSDECRDFIEGSPLLIFF